jgi:predicted lysophospholipase L1 biosynthesis ABC-type transport system permease subunit
MQVSARDDDNSRTPYVVVGVAGNARTQGLRQDVAPRYFVAAEQPPATSASPTFLIRTTSDGVTASVIPAVRKAVERVKPSVPILAARSLEQQMAPSLAQDQATARLAVVFGCVALTLAAVGLYGVLSHGVARRTSEIALRIALGARPGHVVRLILRETSGLVVVGLVLGGALAWAASRLIDSRLYGVAPQDPVTLAAATGLLLLVALGAMLLPARRAPRLDPIAGLRHQ